jgi:hypothetical protein
VEDDTSMTMALKKMNINTPKIRSSKRRENHFYAPYTPSKRRTASDTKTTKPISLSELDSTLVSHIPSGRTDLRPATVHSAQEREEPWGKLISLSEGFSDIILTNDSTGLGELCDSVDIHTGVRVAQFSRLPFSQKC